MYSVQYSVQFTVQCTLYFLVQDRHVGCLSSHWMVTSQPVKTKLVLVFPKLSYLNLSILGKLDLHWKKLTLQMCNFANEGVPKSPNIKCKYCLLCKNTLKNLCQARFS